MVEAADVTPPGWRSKEAWPIGSGAPLWRVAPSNRALGRHPTVITNVPDQARQLDGPDWLNARRSRLAEVAVEAGLPTTELEDWRYSPIGDLDPGRLELTVPATGSFELPERLASLDAWSVRSVDGVLQDLSGDAPVGVSVNRLADVADGSDLVSALPDPVDGLSAFAQALTPDTVVVDIAAGACPDRPVIVVQEVASGSVAGPGLVVRHGADSEATVIEVRAAGAAATALPDSHVMVADAARPRHQIVQYSAGGSWLAGTFSAQVGSQAILRAGVAGFGAEDARLRTDVALTGRGAALDLVSVAQAVGSQTIDFRTFVDHRAADSRSELLFVGTVDDDARSVYSGMIRIDEGAVRSNADQTNRNLKLSERAWAESVPNLEILNNDVHCSHASSMGPIDEDQAFYLASRGVPPVEVERLLVRGFMGEAIDRLPVAGVASEVRAAVDARLAERVALKESQP